MSDHDYGLDDLQPHRPDDLAATTSAAVHWVTPLAVALGVLAVVITLGFIGTVVADDSAADRARQGARECAEQGGRVFEVRHQGSCVANGVRVAQWYVP